MVSATPLSLLSTSLLFASAATPVTASASCGTASGSLVEIIPTLVIGVCADGVLRVVRTPSGVSAKAALLAKRSLMVDPNFPAGVPSFNVSNASGVVTIETATIKATIDKQQNVSFTSAIEKKPLLSEVGHRFTPTHDPAKPLMKQHIIEQSFSADDGEGLYGGGEYQNGLINYRGVPVELVQFNTEASVPFFSSTKGYGLLWDSNSWTYLNPPTGQPIEFSPTPPSPKPFPVEDGTGVGLAVCDKGSFAQLWSYDGSADKRIAFNGSATAVLDCDGCATGKSPHLWHADKTLDANQLWTFTAGGQLQSTKHSSSCLGVSAALSGRSSRGSLGGLPAVQMEACASGKSRWSLDASTGLLRLTSATGHHAGSQSACLAVTSTSTRMGHFTPSESGDHFFFLDMCHGFGCGFNREVYLTLTDPSSGAVQTIQEWDKLTNLPDSLAGAARGLTAGTRYTLSLVSPFEGGAQPERVYAVGPDAARRTVLRSQLGTSIDYYVSHSGVPSLDGAIAGYRTVTGSAPLYGLWAYGFWQCKEHYQHQAELLGAAKRFRELKIPLDAIVQDWHYWGSLGWGPHWDPKYYPDPAGMVANLTANHLKLMVSVWSKVCFVAPSSNLGLPHFWMPSVCASHVSHSTLAFHLPRASTSTAGVRTLSRANSLTRTRHSFGT